MDKANQLLRLREGEIAQGKEPGITFDRIKFDELAEDLLTDYRINGKKSIVKAERSIRNLKKRFGGMKVPRITTAAIKQYVKDRMDESLSNASINRELAALKRAFHLAAQCTPPKVAAIPYIPMLKEDNIRTGFFEKPDFLKLRVALPAYLRPVVNLAYRYGWRIGEIRNLTWDKVDFNAGTIRLDPGMSKN